MTRRKAAVTAWSSFGLGAVAFAASGSLGLASNPYRPPSERLGALDVIWALSVLSVPLVGPILASRRPRNPIGWLLCVMGLGLPLGLFGFEYANYASSVPRNGLPLPQWVALLGLIPFAAAQTSLGLILFLIPSGRLPSRRWRWGPRMMVTGSVVGLVSELLAPGPMEPTAGAPVNPIGIEGAAFLHSLSDIGFGVFGLGILIAALTPLLRYRKADGEVKQQLKWLAFGAVVALLLFVGVMIGDLVTAGGLSEIVGTVAFILAMLSLATGLGISVLKYRLYNIAVVVNRTVVYLLLSVLLGLVYFGGTAVLQGLIGFGGDSDLAVAASTLAVAGLFQPARRRIQGWIDHLFYRRKYDASRTIDDFSSRLRDEIDLNSLNAELVEVVRETMHPTHVSLWLPGRGQAS